ncbi:hypothetical protein ASD08_43575 [Streptomyces sp. Root369]|nr:hypothetical protein ASD08_43575 [Streptomyces sp. Root369]
MRSRARRPACCADAAYPHTVGAGRQDTSSVALRREFCRSRGKARFTSWPTALSGDAAHAELVFERFYRADPARSRLHGGSGLGLAIAATIAEGHGGRLELATAPGRGCTFRLVLPAAGSGRESR